MDNRKSFSREELEAQKKSWEEQLKELLQKDLVDLSEKARLEDEIESIEEQLEELEQEQEQEEDNKWDENWEEETENIDERESEEEKEEEILQETKEREELKEEIPVEEEEELPQDEELRMSLTEWERRSGIDIVPDQYIRQKNESHLTEEEFRDILKYENVPKIIKAPGAAEEFLKSSEDWDSVRTSKSSMKEAFDRGDFPKEVGNEEYLLLEKDEIRDENGNGYIDQVDTVAAKTQEEIREDKETIESHLSEETATNYQVVGAQVAKEMMEKEISEEKQLGQEQREYSALAHSMVTNNEMAEDVSLNDFEKIAREIVNSMDKTPEELEEEIKKEEEKEIEEEGEIPFTPPA